MALTSRQRQDLYAHRTLLQFKSRRQSLRRHSAIHAYLDSRDSFKDVAAAFASAGGVHTAGSGAPSIVPQLERKWSAGIKLQKRIMDLESQLSELQAELHAARSLARGTAATPGSALAVEWLPSAPAVHTLTAHQGSVAALVPHPVFDALVSCGDDGVCHVWGLLEGLLQRERTLRGHTAGVTCGAFAPSGRRLATGSADCRIKVWDFSPAAVGSSGCIRTLSGHDNTVTCLAFMPDGAALVSGSRDGTVRLWDTAGGQCLQTFQAHAGGVRALDVAPDARLLATTGNDGRISVWAVGAGGKVQSGAPLRELVASDKSLAVVRFAPAAQAKRLARKRSHKLRVQAVGKQLAFDVDISHPAAAASSEGGPSAATQGGHSPGQETGGGEDNEQNALPSGGLPAVLLSGGRANTLFVHDADTGECWMTAEAHSAWVKAAEWHPSGTLLVSVGEDSCLHITDVLGATQTRQLSQVHDSFPSALAVCGPSQIVVSAAANGEVKVWASQ